MLKMLPDEQKAYEWAKGQNSTSAAATHAKSLAGYIDRCKADERMLSDPDDKLPFESSKNQY